jgi:hypothetical protein
MASIPPVQVSAGMAIIPQEAFTLMAQQSIVLAPPHYEAASPSSHNYSLQYPHRPHYFNYYPSHNTPTNNLLCVVWLLRS